MTIQEIIQLVKSVGFSESNAPIIAAIAMAESGGNPLAKGVNKDGSIDRGLFQINNKWHSEVPDSCAYNPKCAAKAAYQISNGGKSFSAWVTYTNGAYKKYLPGSSESLGQSQTGSNTSGGIGDLPAMIVAASLGLALILVGVYIIAQPLIHKAASVAIKATPVGRAASQVKDVAGKRRGSNA